MSNLLELDKYSQDDYELRGEHDLVKTAHYLGSSEKRDFFVAYDEKSNRYVHTATPTTAIIDMEVESAYSES
jgi:hypothetical protein